MRLGAYKCGARWPRRRSTEQEWRLGARAGPEREIEVDANFSAPGRCGVSKRVLSARPCPCRTVCARIRARRQTRQVTALVSCMPRQTVRRGARARQRCPLAAIASVGVVSRIAAARRVSQPHGRRRVHSIFNGNLDGVHRRPGSHGPLRRQRVSRLQAGLAIPRLLHPVCRASAAARYTRGGRSRRVPVVLLASHTNPSSPAW
jgi:hypothetical protein